MFDIGADLQRAYDEGYKQGKEDERRWWSNHCANCKDAEQTEPQTEIEIIACPIVDEFEMCEQMYRDEPQTNADQHIQHVESVEPTWTKEEHEAFYTFLWNVINPNEMQDYIEMFETKDEPQKWEKPPKFEHKGIQTACVSVPMSLIEDEPQTERSSE